jgi:hypothetical protein
LDSGGRLFEEVDEMKTRMHEVLKSEGYLALTNTAPPSTDPESVAKFTASGIPIKLNVQQQLTNNLLNQIKVLF